MAALVHLSPHVRSVGGMQTLVRRNLALDRVRGENSDHLAFFDRFDPAVPAAARLGIRGWRSMHAMQKALARRLPATGATIIYYNGWGLPVLADCDRARRRLAFLATDWPQFGLAVAAMGAWCDGFICVSEELAVAVRAGLPDYPAERVVAVPLAAEPPLAARVRRRATGTPLEAGFVARLERDQKRADQLPELVKATRRTGARVNWHIVGDGSQRANLQRTLAGTPDVVLHGALHGDDYRRMLAQLDLIVFLSEYEGAPLAMLDAMAAGVVPLFPTIGGLGEHYAAAVAAGCVYPAGVLAAAARGIAALAMDSQFEALSQRSRAVVAGHGPVAYAAGYTHALTMLTSAPRISLPGGQRRSQLTDWLPLLVVSRFFPDAIWR